MLHQSLVYSIAMLSNRFNLLAHTCHFSTLFHRQRRPIGTLATLRPALRCCSRKFFPRFILFLLVLRSPRYITPACFWLLISRRLFNTLRPLYTFRVMLLSFWGWRLDSARRMRWFYSSLAWISCTSGHSRTCLAILGVRRWRSRSVFTRPS